LKANNIAFDQQSNAVGNTEIQIVDGATVTFKHKTDFEKSTAEERRVTSEDELLVSIVACETHSTNAEKGEEFSDRGIP